MILRGVPLELELPGVLVAVEQGVEVAVLQHLGGVRAVIRGEDVVSERHRGEGILAVLHLRLTRSLRKHSRLGALGLLEIASGTDEPRRRIEQGARSRLGLQ